jgi:hypothetical protein
VYSVLIALQILCEPLFVILEHHIGVAPPKSAGRQLGLGGGRHVLIGLIGPPGTPFGGRILRLLRLALFAALICGIVAASEITDSTKTTEVKTLRYVNAGIAAGMPLSSSSFSTVEQSAACSAPR